MALIKQQNEEILRLQKTIEDNRNIKLKNQLAKAIKEEKVKRSIQLNVCIFDSILFSQKDLSNQIIESLEVKSALTITLRKRNLSITNAT